MARPPANGKTSTNAVLQRAPAYGVTAYEMKPIGDAPANFNRRQKAMWKTLLECAPVLNRSHRPVVIAMARAATRAQVISDYFIRREKECEDAGEDPANAYLSNDGEKRNPLLAELNAVESNLYRAAGSMGMSLSSQAKIFAAISGSQPTPTKAQLKEAQTRGRYFA